MCRFTTQPIALLLSINHNGRMSKYSRLLAILALACCAWPIGVSAQSSSTNYKVEEVFFGIGGELEATSPNYRAQQSAGSLGVGAASSANYRAQAGFLTDQTPFLEVVVSGSTVNLGNLSVASTAGGASQGGTCNCSFTVRTYLSNTYVVKTMSNPPTSENNVSLAPKTTLGAPIIGTEEFGINLVANTSPASFGVVPANQPDNSFADGQAASGYSTADQYKYVVGDTIARSPATAGNQAIGQTNYTISYIANLSSLTRAGVYTMNQDLVAVPTY